MMRVKMLRDFGKYKKDQEYTVNETVRVEMMTAGAAVRTKNKPAEISKQDKSKVKKSNG